MTVPNRDSIDLDDVRNALGTTEDPILDDAPIEHAISEAYATLARQIASGVTLEDAETAIIADAALRALGTNRDAFIEHMEALDIAEDIDVATLIDERRQARTDLVDAVTHRGHGSFATAVTPGSRSEKRHR